MDLVWRARNMNANELWNRYKKHLCRVPAVGLTLDISRMTFDDGFFARMAPAMEKAFAAMDALEKGAIANPDEKRMVGHYWLRAPELAPDAGDHAARSATRWPRSRRSRPTSTPARSSRSRARRFTQLALDRHRRLGARARCSWPTRSAIPAADKMSVTSSTTPTPTASPACWRGWATRSARRWSSSSPRAAARRRPATACWWSPRPIRQRGPRLRHATPWPSPAPARSWISRPGAKAGWRRFPMWDWVGGRTSELSAVGLLPAAAAGARHRRHARRRRRDATRPPARTTPRSNPAALLALMWYHATGGKGAKDMVVLPYKDRLLLFSPLPAAARHGVARQAARPEGQAGRPGHHRLRQQGLDRPARLRAAAPRRREQLLRHLHAGARGRRRPRPEVEPGVTPGDYLHGFLLGTREALFENDRAVDDHHGAAASTPGRSAR